MHPLAIDAENEWKEEQAALATIDRSRYVYKFRPLDSEAMRLPPPQTAPVTRGEMQIEFLTTLNK